MFNVLQDGDLDSILSRLDALEAAVGTAAFTMPNTAGTSGQVITSNGTGGSSWQTPSGSGGSASYKTVNYNYDPSVTGSLTLTGAGFTPKAALVIMSQANTKRVSIGTFAGSTATDQGVILQTPTTGNWSPSASYVVFVQDAVGSTEAKMAWTAWTSDGMTVNRTKVGSPTGTVQVTVFYFG